MYSETHESSKLYKIMYNATRDFQIVIIVDTLTYLNKIPLGLQTLVISSLYCRSNILTLLFLWEVYHLKNYIIVRVFVT